MKNAIRQPAKPVPDAKRSFNWGIKTSEVVFADPAGWDAPLEGCNCGPLVITPRPRERLPVPSKR